MGPFTQISALSLQNVLVSSRVHHQFPDPESGYHQAVSLLFLPVFLKSSHSGSFLLGSASWSRQFSMYMFKAQCKLPLSECLNYFFMQYGSGGSGFNTRSPSLNLGGLASPVTSGIWQKVSSCDFQGLGHKGRVVSTLFAGTAHQAPSHQLRSLAICNSEGEGQITFEVKISPREK